MLSLLYIWPKREGYNFDRKRLFQIVYTRKKLIEKSLRIKMSLEDNLILMWIYCRVRTLQLYILILVDTITQQVEGLGGLAISKHILNLSHNYFLRI